MLAHACNDSKTRIPTWRDSAPQIHLTEIPPLDLNMFGIVDGCTSIDQTDYCPLACAANHSPCGNFLNVSNLVAEHKVIEIEDCQSKYNGTALITAHPRRANWRPFALRNIYLTFITVLSIALAIGEEVLYQYSYRLEAMGKALLSFPSIYTLSYSYYFFWRFMLPVGIVSYGALVGAVDHQIMRMAPFYKLSRPQGLSGYEFFLRDHTSYLTYLWRPRKAGSLVFMSASMTVLASVVAPIAQSFVFVTNWSTDLDTVTVSAVSSRLLSITLLFVACGCSTIQWELRRRDSGVFEDPGGICGIARLLAGGHLLEDLANVDANISEDNLYAHLKRSHYILKNGIFHRLPGYDIQDDTISKAPNPQRLSMSRSYFGVLLACGAIICTYAMTIALTPADMIAVKIPSFSTLVAVLYKTLWSTFDIFIRTTEPYWQLTCGQALPSTLFEDYTGLPAIALPAVALWRHNWHLALIGMCTILAELLVICLSSISENSASFLLEPLRLRQDPEPSDSTFTTLFWTAIASAGVIPLVMSISLFSVWLKRRRSWLARPPQKLAGLLLYLHSTNFMDHLRSRSNQLSRDELRKELEEMGKKYAIGWFAVPDGKQRMAIDEEPRISEYQPNKEKA